MDATLTELTGGFAARQLPGFRPAAEQADDAADASSDDAIARSGTATGDSISLSNAAHAALSGEQTGDQAPGQDTGTDQGAGTEADQAADNDASGEDDKDSDAEPGAARGADGEPLSEEESREVERLETRDQEVRTHEQAHQAAGGPHAGSPSYDYETGPDGKQYATSGEVPIDTAAVAGDPAATIAKMEQVKRAALAPAEPSSADRAIAAKADQAKLKAQQELREQQAQGTGAAEGAPPPPGTEPAGARPGPGAPTDEAEETAPPASYAGRGSLLSLNA